MTLATEATVELETSAQEATFRAAEGNYDLVLVNLSLAEFDALRLCSLLRSIERTRTLPILLITEPDEMARLERGLDLGVNDYLIRPVDRQELLARARTQIRRKRYTDRLRDTVQQTLELAVIDALTGLHNRRYLDGHLANAIERALTRSTDLALLILDIDYFKKINDSHGHDAGDAVLREFSQRVARNLRSVDLACRYGGEEFVIIMPETDRQLALLVAERLRSKIADEPFAIQGGARFIDVTVSIGLACLESPADNAATLLKRADDALYRAKAQGRNRVVPTAA